MQNSQSSVTIFDLARAQRKQIKNALILAGSKTEGCKGINFCQMEMTKSVGGNKLFLSFEEVSRDNGKWNRISIKNNCKSYN